MDTTKKNPSILFILGLILLWGCNRDKDIVPPYVHVTGWSQADQQTLAYMFQPLGTVFIYRDSISGAMDTVTVIARVTDTTEYWYESIKNTPGYYIEGQYQANYSSFDGGQTSYHVTLGDPFRSTYFTLSKSKWGLGLGQSYFLQCPFYVGLEFSTSLFYTKIEKLHSTMDVNGQTYSNVFEILTKKESTEDFADVRYFYAKNIGLIKKINYKNNSNWNLQVIHLP